MRKGIVDTSRRDKIVELREAGLTYVEIGCRQTPPISKQRVERIVKGNRKPPEPDLDSKLLLRTGEVAQLLGLHVNTVRRWSRQGVLKSYIITPRGDRRFKREDVECLLKEAEIE